jgi:hypothetical protein
MPLLLPPPALLPLLVMLAAVASRQSAPLQAGVRPSVGAVARPLLLLLLWALG